MMILHTLVQFKQIRFDFWVLSGACFNRVKGACPNMDRLLDPMFLSFEESTLNQLLCSQTCHRIDEFCWLFSSFAKVPNRLKLYKEQVNGRERAAYACRRARHGLYSAAVKLWAEGVPLPKALDIVRGAMQQSME